MIALVLNAAILLLALFCIRLSKQVIYVEVKNVMQGTTFGFLRILKPCLFMLVYALQKWWSIFFKKERWKVKRVSAKYTVFIETYHTLPFSYWNEHKQLEQWISELFVMETLMFLVIVKAIIWTTFDN